ncbi:MAG: AIM24 family protein [Actinobacteria bacterium]|nr:AIM24 family protein [Actinomycetota bacterium]
MGAHEIDYKIYGNEIQFVEVELDPGESVIAEAGSFMMMDREIEMETIFGDGADSNRGFASKLLGVGFFGGEGFIMQKLEGDGMAFVHAGGTIHEKVLQPGETIKLDTGCLVAMTRSVGYDIEFVKGVKTFLFGGEGLFFAALRGPGRVWIQSLPFSRLASRVIACAPQTGGKARGEGSILGALGNVLDGDNKF